MLIRSAAHVLNINDKETNIMKNKQLFVFSAFFLTMCIFSHSSQAQIRYYDTSTPEGQQGYAQQQQLYAEQQQAQQMQQMQQMQQQQLLQQQQMQQMQMQMQQQQQQQHESDPLGLMGGQHDNSGLGRY